MEKIGREDIHIISRHSNWSENGIKKALKLNVYNDINAWHKFFRLFFIALGTCFITSGIIFFFAYNWANLHKFVKIGMIEGLIIAVSLVLFSKLKLYIKNIVLTGTSVLVGVLFAVFGQVYQTGANAYDFFLGWTIFITLWVLVSKFAPLWLVYLTLINNTLILYSEQVAHNWTVVFLFTLLFIINVSFLMFFLLSQRYSFLKEFKMPVWFTNLIALVAVYFATIGIAFGIFDKFQNSFLVLILMTIIIYFLGIKYGLKEKSLFYLSIIPFSLIFVFSAFLLKISKNAGMLFAISLFVIIAITLLILKLVNIKKTWTND